MIRGRLLSLDQNNHIFIGNGTFKTNTVFGFPVFGSLLYCQFAFNKSSHFQPVLLARVVLQAVQVEAQEARAQVLQARDHLVENLGTRREVSSNNLFLQILGLLAGSEQ